MGGRVVQPGRVAEPGEGGRVIGRHAVAVQKAQRQVVHQMACNTCHTGLNHHLPSNLHRWHTCTRHKPTRDCPPREAVVQQQEEAMGGYEEQQKRQEHGEDVALQLLHEEELHEEVAQQQRRRHLLLPLCLHIAWVP